MNCVDLRTLWLNPPGSEVVHCGHLLIEGVVVSMWNGDEIMAVRWITDPKMWSAYGKVALRDRPKFSGYVVEYVPDTNHLSIGQI